MAPDYEELIARSAALPSYDPRLDTPHGLVIRDFRRQFNDLAHWITQDPDVAAFLSCPVQIFDEMEIIGYRHTFPSHLFQNNILLKTSDAQENPAQKSDRFVKTLIDVHTHYRGPADYSISPTMSVQGLPPELLETAVLTGDAIEQLRGDWSPDARKAATMDRLIDEFGHAYQALNDHGPVSDSLYVAASYIGRARQALNKQIAFSQRNIFTTPAMHSLNHALNAIQYPDQVIYS